jgi:lipoprotein LprA
MRLLRGNVSFPRRRRVFMKLRSRGGIAVVSAIVAVALVLAGCSSKSNQGGSSTAPNGDAANTVKQAADAMRKVTGMHMSLTVQGNVPSLQVTKLDGDVSNTPQPVATGTATVTVGDTSKDAKFVYVDGHLYSDLADPGKYTNYGDGISIYDVSTLLDPDRGLAMVLSNLKDPKVAGTEQVNGIPTTKITGSSTSNDIARLAGRRLGPQDVTTTPTTVWIASDGSYHLVRLEIVPVQNGTVTLTMSDWGKTVTATKPA